MKIIKSFGKINENILSYELEFKFKPGKNYTISNNGLIATKTGGGNNWNCSIIGDKEIPKNKRHTLARGLDAAYMTKSSHKNSSIMGSIASPAQYETVNAINSAIKIRINHALTRIPPKYHKHYLLKIFILLIEILCYYSPPKTPSCEFKRKK